MADKIFNEDKPYIFVSYSHKDKDAVEKTVSELRRRFGINIWYDAELYAGKNWDDVAITRLWDNDCKAVLFFASIDALTSENVGKELEEAKSFDRIIIPVNFENRSFDEIVKVDINNRYIKSDPEKLRIALGIVRKHLDTKLTYIVYDIDSDEYYNSICWAVKHNAPEIEIRETVVHTKPAAPAPEIIPDAPAKTAEIKESASAEPPISAPNTEKPESKDPDPTINVLEGVYEGELKDGKRDGHGVLTFIDGAVFDGEFKDGEPNGQGTYTYSNTYQREGTFKKGSRKLSRGDFNGIYIEDGNLFGRGFMNYGGNEYSGEIKNGRPHGHGKMKYRDETVKEGKWKDGKFIG